MNKDRILVRLQLFIACSNFMETNHKSSESSEVNYSKQSFILYKIARFIA